MKTAKKLSVFFVVFCVVSAVAQSHPFTVEQIMSAPYASSLATAKQTGRVAWVFNLKGERNVWVADAPNFQAR